MIFRPHSTGNRLSFMHDGGDRLILYEQESQDHTACLTCLRLFKAYPQGLFLL